MRTPHSASKPWYREPWPWFLMALPLTAIIGGAITAWFAVTSNDGLVADDYYKKGLAINQTLHRDEEAGVLHLQAALTRSDGGTLTMRLRGDFKTYPQQVQLRILYPTRAGKDQTVSLQAVAPGSYAGHCQTLSRGKWYLILEDNAKTWRLLGEWEVPQTRTVSLAAGDGKKVM